MKLSSSLKKASRVGQFVFHSSLVIGGCRMREMTAGAAHCFLCRSDAEGAVDHPLRKISNLVKEALASLARRMPSLQACRLVLPRPVALKAYQGLLETIDEVARRLFGKGLKGRSALHRWNEPHGS